MRVNSAEDAGAYQCFATNKVGTIQVSFQLQLLAEGNCHFAEVVFLLLSIGWTVVFRSDRYVLEKFCPQRE